ncbi:hypothetical protein B0O80DRAFT_462509 [Mortierella sp. GBAus27b]|nr:hypothetical protein B0O80DRAFT_462509 [Mortierella sp. GBAus27b]
MVQLWLVALAWPFLTCGTSYRRTGQMQETLCSVGGGGSSLQTTLFADTLSPLGKKKARLLLRLEALLETDRDLFGLLLSTHTRSLLSCLAEVYSNSHGSSPTSHRGYSFSPRHCLGRPTIGAWDRYRN